MTWVNLHSVPTRQTAPPLSRRRRAARRLAWIALVVGCAAAPALEAGTADTADTAGSGIPIRVEDAADRTR